MSQTSNPRVPSYRLHKPSALAVVRLDGRDVYLGKHGSPESHVEYRRVIAEWLASKPARAMGNTRAGDASVNELALAFLDHARTYYVKNGRPTGEMLNLRDALRPLVSMYGDTPAHEFGPRGLKAVRQTMVDAGLSRGVVNQRVNRLRRVFKWGVENEIVPASVLQGLQAVASLKRGRCGEREADGVKPVPDRDVDATIAAAPPQIGAMIQLQRLTGMRPGELVVMRGRDIDTGGKTWTFTPMEHKTEHHGRARVVYLGPQAQRILASFLKRDLDAFIFAPIDVAGWRSRERRRNRRTPLTPSQRARRAKENPRRSAGERYTTLSYAQAVRYACDRAFPHPTLARRGSASLSKTEQDDLKLWRKEHRWSPNRLRHNAATFLRREFGIEAARVVLGHGSADVTEIYAEQDLARAAEIMGRVG